MNATELNNTITANNDGLIMAAGYELAIVKNGKVVATGNDVSAHTFNITGNQFIECFSKIIDIREHNTPQHNHTTAEGVKIPHAGEGETA